MQKLHFRELGFKVNTLVIDGLSSQPRPNRRYGTSLQYVFVLSKGRPRVFNPIRDVENQSAGEDRRSYDNLPDGTRAFNGVYYQIPTLRRRSAVWDCKGGRYPASRDAQSRTHPAPMCERLAAELIYSWSTDGDVVLDPMSGSGTTAKMALLNNRRYLGFEIHREYHDMAVRRLAQATEKYLAA